MPLTQSTIDSFKANAAEFSTLVAGMVADTSVTPPATANTYISASHPGPNTPPSLTSTDKAGTLTWCMYGLDKATGLMRFEAGGSSSTQILGSKLVLQNGNAYAKQPDGSWKAATRWGPAAVPAGLVVIDPEGA